MHDVSNRVPRGPLFLCTRLVIMLIIGVERGRRAGGGIPNSGGLVSVD